MQYDNYEVYSSLHFQGWQSQWQRSEKSIFTLLYIASILFFIHLETKSSLSARVSVKSAFRRHQK